jgi:hypothetical protein
MNHIQIVGKVIKQLTKKNFENDIAINAVYMEIPQVNDDTEILRVSLWDEGISHKSAIFNEGDYFLMDGYFTLWEDDPEYIGEIDTYFEFTVMDFTKLANNSTFFL